MSDPFGDGRDPLVKAMERVGERRTVVDEIMRLRAALADARCVLQLYDHSKAWLAERDRILERIAQLKL